MVRTSGQCETWWKRRGGGGGSDKNERRWKVIGTSFLLMMTLMKRRLHRRDGLSLWASRASSPSQYIYSRRRRWRRRRRQHRRHRQRRPSRRPSFFDRRWRSRGFTLFLRLFRDGFQSRLAFSQSVHKLFLIARDYIQFIQSADDFGELLFHAVRHFYSWCFNHTKFLQRYSFALFISLFFVLVFFLFCDF